MTDDQFKSLAYLMRLRKGSKTSNALNLYYVEGLGQAESATAAGLNAQSIWNALNRAKKALKAAKELHS